MTSRRLPSISTVPNPCVDVIRLADSPSISPDSIRIKPASPPTRFLHPVIRDKDEDKEYETPSTLKSVPAGIVRPGRRKRRRIFSVAPDDENPSFRNNDSSEAVNSEDIFGGAQETGRIPQDRQKIRPSDESSISDAGSRQSPPQSNTPRTSSTDLDSPLHGLRPWHALTEIVSTELSYVYDLRKLAYVYFPALSTLPLGPSTSAAVQRLGDNVSELLDFHESFLKSLQSVKKHGSNIENLDDAIERIAQLFISKASQFDLYKSFCSSQPEVHGLLGAERVRYKTEWKLFEQYCAAGGSCSSSAAADATEGTNSRSEPGHTAPGSVDSHSTPPSSPFAKARIPSSSTFAFLKVSTSSRGLSEMERSCSGIQRSLSVDSVTMAGRKLRFHDFLIKPVQRLCRYPILIQSLRQSKTHSERIDAALVQALQSMHAVTTRVDEAQRVSEETRKSKLIMDRIETHSVVSDEFLRSLDNCILAGPLDVAYHHHVYNPIDPPIRVRYMAAFLFAGGYLIFAKVSKNRSYRIKHWFNASSFEIVDIPEEEALVPHAFRLSSLDHHFEIAAACSSEKELWIQSIKKAIRPNNSWASEPPSSLETRQYIPSAASFSQLQLESSPLKETFSSALVNDDQQRPHIATRSSLRNRLPATPGGTAKLFSIGDGPPLLLKRSTAAERDLVDREMKDIQTVSVTDCRIHAQTRSETMFPPPKFTQPVQVMAMATTNKLVRRGSWLLYRSRNPGSGSGLNSNSGSGSGLSGVEPEETGIVVSPNRRTNRIGPSIAPSLSALHSEPECVDVVEKSPLSNEYEPIMTGSETMHELPSSSDGAQANDSSPKTPTHRRKNSFAASIKGLVRKAASKRSSVQLEESTTTDVSQSRRRVSSAPPSPPQTGHEHETKDVNTFAIDGSLDSYRNLPCTSPTSPLKPRSSLKKMIFRH